MLQGGSDVDLLYSWRLERAQGCSGAVQRRLGPRKPGASWAGRLGGLGKAWGVITSPSRRPATWVLGRLLGGGAAGAVGKVLTFCHAVQYHVNEDVSASPPRAVAEMGDDDKLSSGPSRKGKGQKRQGGLRCGRHWWGHWAWLGEGVSELRKQQSQPLGPGNWAWSGEPGTHGVTLG